MATFAGLIARRPEPTRLGVSVNLNNLSLDQTTNRAARLVNPRYGAYIRADGRGVYTKARIGALAEQLMQYVYGRVIIYPDALYFGSVATEQTSQIYVWNASLIGRSVLEVVDSPEQGVTLSGQPNPPILMNALEERVWTVSVAGQGAPVIQTQLSWRFSNYPTLKLSVSGNRIRAWSFRHNWSASVREGLSWLTSLQTTPLGVEQRRKLRQSPRRSFQVQTIALPAERQYMELLLADWGAKPWAIPIWPDAQSLEREVGVGASELPCETAGFDFREGGLLMLRGATALDFEVLQVDEVLAGKVVLTRPTSRVWPRGTLIYPARIAVLAEQPKARSLTSDIYISEQRFDVEEVCDWPEATWTRTYRGRPVLLLRPEASEDRTSTYARIMSMLDSGTDFPGRVDTAQLGFTATSHRFDPVGRQQAAEFRSILYYLAGRYRSIWLPTFNDDLTVVDRVKVGDDVLTVANVGYSRFSSNVPGKRDLAIFLRNGAVHFARVVSASLDQQGNDTLYLAEALSFNALPSAILRVSYLARCRLDQDNVELNHITAGGEVFANTTFRSLRDDLGED